MIDEILSLKSSKLPIYIICNYQTSEEEGSHHIAIYKDKHNSFHFDSFGIEPPKEVVEFMKYNCENCYSSTFQIQKFGSRMCGEFALFVLYELKNDKNFFYIVLDLLENND